MSKAPKLRNVLYAPALIRNADNCSLPINNSERVPLGFPWSRGSVAAICARCVVYDDSGTVFRTMSFDCTIHMRNCKIRFAGPSE
jgi:hypothetical protein